MISREDQFLKVQHQLQQIIERVKAASVEGRRIDEVERLLFVELLLLGFGLLAAFVELAGDGDVGETIAVPARPRVSGTPDPAARTLMRLSEKHARPYVSIFGRLTISRFVYGTREGQAIEAVPLDARLALPSGEFSYVLEDWQQRLCVKESFGEATGDLAEILGIAPSVRAAEVMNQKLSEFADSFRFDEQQPPPSAEEGELVAFTSDCKGVPMRRPRSQVRTSPHRRSKGEKANKKQMACVGAVYTIDRFPRTADDVLEELARREAARDRPQPCHKHVWAEMTRTIEGEEYNGKTMLFGELAEEVRARNPEGQKPVVALMDGEKALWNMLETFLPEAEGVLDLFHVIERLWTAAHVFHAEGSRQAEAFVDIHLRRLLEGDVGSVIRGFKLRLAKNRLPNAKRQSLQSTITYFENNREHMRYDEYLRKGYPIGSGVAEGACRHLVKDRLEQTGMRWTVAGAQAMLHLRALYLNGDWPAFIEHRARREQARLYPYKSSLT